MIEEVLEMGIEKEIETEIETVIEIPENLKENVLYAINLVISPEIVLNQIQEGGTLIRKNPMVFIIGTGEAEVGVEVEPGQEITIIHLVRENHGGTRKIKIIEVDLQVEAGIIIGMIIAKGGKILMNGEKKIPLAVKVEAGAEVEALSTSIFSGSAVPQSFFSGTNIAALTAFTAVSAPAPASAALTLLFIAFPPDIFN